MKTLLTLVNNIQKLYYLYAMIYKDFAIFSGWNIKTTIFNECYMKTSLSLVNVIWRLIFSECYVKT